MKTPHHIDLAAFERSLRENFSIPLPADASDYMHVQKRANEVNIQFGLWVMGEVNLGTDPDDILGSAAIIIGNMLGNLNNHFAGPPGSSIAMDIVERVVEMIQNFNDDDEAADLTRTAYVPRTEGGNA